MEVLQSSPVKSMKTVHMARIVHVARHILYAFKDRRSINKGWLHSGNNIDSYN